MIHLLVLLSVTLPSFTQGEKVIIVVLTFIVLMTYSIEVSCTDNAKRVTSLPGILLHVLLE